jgi:hypothetical protein
MTDKTIVHGKRMNVALPAGLASLLEELVPKGERNRFVVAALGKALQRARLERALERSAGAWTDENHPNLKTVEDIDRYIRRLRETWMPRSWDEIVAEAEPSEQQPA